MSNQTTKRIKEIEEEMQIPGFWDDKKRAAELTQELHELKKSGGGSENYPAILTIISGAGGDDAEDFARMLFEMYYKFFEREGWEVAIIEKKETEHKGLKSGKMEVLKKGSYATLKNESGVHRLVRVSPFNAKKQRHTSFALVEVIPKLPPLKEVIINPEDVEVFLARSSGPGGQNVNKRETSVRIKHKETGILVHCEGERSQARNKECALEILRGKLFTLKKEQREKAKSSYSSKDVSIEWGNQIRSYVLHPYKMVKDHRTNYEERFPEKVFDGHIGCFLKNKND
ncbi:MAG: PCRF domain-containing protein [Candidatus Campbellbacteria bacterium]|nr:PCRF domain-containing protein [Candidatus Campbellbacteria bacterium]